MRSPGPRRRARPVWVAALAVLCTACGTVTPAEPTPAPSTTREATTEPPTSVGDAVECLAGDVPFEEEGVIASFGSVSGDAAAITGFHWTTETGCERFVVDLATVNGSPAASLGSTVVQLRPGSGVLRIELPAEVGASSVAETTVDGVLVASAYVVRLVDGRLAVDLHLDAPTGLEARSFLVRSPARIVVDLRPEEADPAVVPPSSTDGLVLVEPREGVAGYPLTVRGYTRLPDPEVVIALAPGTPDRLDLTPAVAPEGSTWTEIEGAAAEGPTGIVELIVEVRAEEDRRRIAVLLDLQ